MENPQTPHTEHAPKTIHVEQAAHAAHTEHQTPNVTSQKTENEKGNGNSNGKQILMGILSYLGILIVIPYAFGKSDPFVKFHIKQGLVLITIDVILWVVSNMFWEIRSLIGLLNILVFVLVIIGIVNVAKKKQEELPVVGSFAKYFDKI